MKAWSPNSPRYLEGEFSDVHIQLIYTRGEGQSQQDEVREELAGEAD